MVVKLSRRSVWEWDFTDSGMIPLCQPNVVAHVPESMCMPAQGPQR